MPTVLYFVDWQILISSMEAKSIDPIYLSSVLYYSFFPPPACPAYTAHHTTHREERKEEDAMKSATLVRTSSMPIQKLSVTDPIKPSSVSYLAGCSCRWSSGNLSSSPVRSLQRNDDFSSKTGCIRRTASASNSIPSDRKSTRANSPILEIGSLQPASCSIPVSFEEETGGVGSWPPMEEMVSFIGGGIDEGGGRRSGVGGDQDRRKIGEYYEEMLRSNPGDALLLRNYGKYLHEVEKNEGKAEEYYGRAILASDEIDGELLSLYGKLIWETQRDEQRAKSYFDQALHASPHDCMVLGSYAHFLWEAADEEEEDEEEEREKEMERESAVVAGGDVLVGANS